MTRILPESNFTGLQGSTTVPGRRPWVWDTNLRKKARGFAGIPGEFEVPSSKVAREAVIMELNPSSIQIQQTKRIARADVRGGAVFYHGVNVEGADNDILILSISGSSGDIRVPPQRAAGTAEPGEGNTNQEVEAEKAWLDAVRRRFREFWKLVQMSREPILLSDGTVNKFFLTMVSPVFQIDVTFEGFFSQPLTWSESATEKGSITWDCEFTVNRVTPSFADYVAQVTAEDAYIVDRTRAEAEIELINNEQDRRDAAITETGAFTA